jgi:ABC-type polysaccharide/polyol phosphate transport system ATPase subunit
MSTPAVTFDRVWKKFRRGERLDTMRDVAVSFLKNPFAKRTPPEQLAAQEFWALKDVSFEVHPGEALGIIGPNGAGKSTTLKLLTKILKPTMGTCSARGRVGALIEIAAGFHPDLTGRENLYLQGAILGMTRREITAKLEQVVEFSGIREFIDTPVKRYSSGMNARLGFSIAAHVDPDVLVIDEVLSVGDYLFQQKCQARLEEFRRSGAAIVFVSHNMQAIASLCDRALLLRPHKPPILAGVAEVSALYAAADKEVVDPRVTVRRFRLSHRGRHAPLPAAIAPGTPLTLDVDIEANTDLPRCNIFFEVVRTDGLKMFNHTPMGHGEPPMDLEAGCSFTSRIHFRANVLRGTYRVLLHLSDAERVWPPIEIAGLASFVVQDTTREGGCAELEPSYELRVDRPTLAHYNVR